jgi:hypothetical protein
MRMQVKGDSSKVRRGDALSSLQINFSATQHTMVHRVLWSSLSLLLYPLSSSSISYPTTPHALHPSTALPFYQFLNLITLLLSPPQRSSTLKSSGTNPISFSVRTELSVTVRSTAIGGDPGDIVYLGKNRREIRYERKKL